MAKPNPTTSKPPSDQDARLQLLDHFDDVFKCTICLSKLDDPHLCPHCSKLYCYDCISGWLLSESEQHLYCPNCKVELQVNKLVKVRWFEEAEKLQRSVLEPTETVASSATDGDPDRNGATAKEKDICPKHSKGINFYCCTCELGVCDECAVAGGHLEHTFKTLDVIYNRNMKIAEGEFEQVRHYATKIASLIERVDHNVELVKKVKEKNLEEIASAVVGIDRQVNEKLKKLQDDKVALMAEMQGIEQSLQLMEGEVKAFSRLQFIAKKSKIINDCNKIRMNPIKDFEQIRVPVGLKIENSISESAVFVIKKFSTLKTHKQAFSKEFTDNGGHSWRILAKSSEGYLGVYLELVKGSPCRMECQFQLLHTDSERIICRKTVHQYQGYSTTQSTARQTHASVCLLAKNKETCNVLNRCARANEKCACALNLPIFQNSTILTA